MDTIVLWGNIPTSVMDDALGYAYGVLPDIEIFFLDNAIGV